MGLRPFVSIPQTLREWTLFFRRTGLDELLSGTGSPEGNVTANVGTLYRRLDGGASTTLYVKESGTGNTGWIAK